MIDKWGRIWECPLCGYDVGEPGLNQEAHNRASCGNYECPVREFDAKRRANMHILISRESDFGE